MFMQALHEVSIPGRSKEVDANGTVVEKGSQWSIISLGFATEPINSVGRDAVASALDRQRATLCQYTG